MRIRYRIASALAGAGLFVGSVWFVVTSDRFVQRMVADVLGRTFAGPTRFASARFSIADGLVVEGLELADVHDPLAKPAVHVRALRADWGLFLFAGGPRVTEVVLEGPAVRVRRLADGTLSAAGLLRQQRDDDPDATRPPVVRIEDGTMVYEDATLVRGGALELTRVTATAEPAGDSWTIRFAARSAELGPIEGTTFVAPGSAVSAHVDLREFVVSPQTLGRLLLPGADEATRLRARGKIRVHAEVSYAPGAAAKVSAKVELAGMRATVTLPEHQPGVAPPLPFEVLVTHGTAELLDGAVELTGLAIEALGGTVRCDHARVADLRGDGGPQVNADLVVESVAVDETLRAVLPAFLREVLVAHGLAGSFDAKVGIRGRALAPSVDVEGALTRGTVRFEGFLADDGRRHGFPWTVEDVTLAIAFREGSLVVFEGGGRRGSASVRAKGTVRFRSGDALLDLAIVAEKVPIDDALRAALLDHGDAVFGRWGPGGVASRIEVHCVRDPHADGGYGVPVELSIEFDGDAELQPRCLPTRISGVRGRIEVLAPVRGDRRIDRVVLHSLTGRGDGFELAVDGRVDNDHGAADEDLVFDVAVKDAARAFAPALAASGELVPPGVRRLVADLGLGGALTVHAAIAGDTAVRRDRVAVAFHGASTTGFGDIPFALSAIGGAVVHEGDVVRLESLHASALGTTLLADGRITGLASEQPEPEISLEAADAPLGEAMRRALGPLAVPAAAFWEKLRPDGDAESPGPDAARADVGVVLRPSTDATPFELTLTSIRGRLSPLGFALSVTDGELHYDGREVTARLEGRSGEAPVKVTDARYDVRTRVLDVTADAEGLRFPEDVESLFGPEGAESIRSAIPGRVLDLSRFRAAYDPAQESVTLSGDLRIRPADPDAPDPPGLAPAGILRVDRVTLWFPPDLPVAFDGSVVAEQLRLAAGVRVRDFHGRIAVAGRIDPDGAEVAARAVGASLRVEDVPVTGADVEMTPRPRGVQVDLTGELWGGKVTAHVAPGVGRTAVAGSIRIRGVDVARIARGGGEGGGVEGTLTVDADFRTASGEARDLTGGVEANVADGKLGEFPVISSVLNLFGGSAGDLTSGFLKGKLRGRRIEIVDATVRGARLVLQGGRGTIGLDGALDVALDPVFDVIIVKVPVPITTVHVGGTVERPAVSTRYFGKGLDADEAKPGGADADPRR